MANIEEIKRVAKQIRIDSVNMTLHAGGGHISPVLSCAEILAALYLDTLRYKTDDPQWAERDRFILSKGHAVQGLYSILQQVGFIKVEDNTYGNDHTRYIGHAPKNFPGVDFATGSMGHGLCVGAGMALAAKANGNPAKVYVLCGDGEMGEGSVWEAALFAARYQLDNLVLIVDNNGIQHDSYTDDILPTGDLEEKLSAFGFEAYTVDGHDIDALLAAFHTEPKGKPIAIVAKTIKGKGVSFMENQVAWHFGVLTEDDAKLAMKELTESEG